MTEAFARDRPSSPAPARARRKPPAKIYGSTTPRIATRRGRGRSRGAELVAFATNELGLEVLPWQAWIYDRALERLGDRWRRRTVLGLAARQNGKTKLTTIRVLGGMTLWGEDVIGAAQSRDVALESWTDALETAETAGLDVRDVKRATGRESFQIGEHRYKIASSTRGGGRGLSGDLVILDELREMVDWRAYSALEKTRRARPSSQFWSISNEGDLSSVVLHTLAGQGETWAGDTNSPIGFYSWSAGPELERADPRGWVQANPALGYLIDIETIEQELRTDPPDVFETEVLCRPVTVIHPWLPEGIWPGCAEPRAPLPDGPGIVCLGVDAGPELRHGSIAVAWRRGEERVGVDLADAFDEADGPVLPRLAVRLAELLERWKPPGVAVEARTPGAATVARVCADVAGVDVDELAPADLGRAAAGFYDSAARRLVAHMADPVLDAAIGLCSSDRAGAIPTRRSRAADIDAARAAMLAHFAVLARPPVKTSTWIAY